MLFEEYIQEMTKYSKLQKDDLSHFIINILSNKETWKLLKQAKSKKENIVISKEDADVIISNLSKIRTFIKDLPIEDE